MQLVESTLGIVKWDIFSGQQYAVWYSLVMLARSQGSQSAITREIPHSIADCVAKLRCFVG
jgi:hypothetical protein